VSEPDEPVVVVQEEPMVAVNVTEVPEILEEFESEEVIMETKELAPGMFDRGELVYSVNPEELNFTIIYYLGDEMVEFTLPEGRMYLRIYEGEFDPDWMNILRYLDSRVPVIDQMRIDYDSSNTIITVKKADIKPTVEQKLTVMVLTDVKRYYGNSLGILNAIGETSYSVLTIDKDW
jgi:hypothetical protein